MMVEMHGVSGSNNNGRDGGTSSPSSGGGGGAGASGPHVPAFLAKLWKLVDDPETNSLIYWSDGGNSFVIRNQARFSRDLLPLYYKHNNMASFIRQLNMYGFHKVVSVDQGGLKVDKDEMEFAHPFFLRGNEASLELIKRKISIPKHDDSRIRSENLQKALMDVRQMKGRQDKMDVSMGTMKQENEALWEELSSLRHKHANQTTILSKILQFLMGVMQPRGGGQLGFKRKMPLMIGGTEDGGNSSSASTVATTTSGGGSGSRPIIRDVTDLLMSSMDMDGSKSKSRQGKVDDSPVESVTLGRPTFMEVEEDSEVEEEEDLAQSSSSPPMPSTSAGRKRRPEEGPSSTVIATPKESDILQMKDTLLGGALESDVDEMQAELNDLHELLRREKFTNLEDSSFAGMFGEKEADESPMTSMQSSSSPLTDQEMISYSPSLFELTDDSHFFDDSSSANMFWEDDLQNVMAKDKDIKFTPAAPASNSSIPFNPTATTVSKRKRM